MEPAPLRAGIIGLGFIGAGDEAAAQRLGQRVVDLDGTHCEALSGHPRIQLVAGSSSDAGRRERFAQRTGATLYADWRQMLASERLDIVSVATKTPTHAEQTIGCAEAGVRAVYCEKPIAGRLVDAERMIAACRRAGTLLVINHNRRFMPNYRQLADRIAKGDLGKLTSVSLQWGSGRLGNVGTHFIDAALMLTRRRVLAVSATLDLSGRPDCRGPEFQDPGGWAMLRMEGGLMGLVNAPDYATAPGEIVISGTSGQSKILGNEVRISFADGRHEEWPHVRDRGTGMDQAVREIVDFLDNNAPLANGPDEALLTLEAITGCHVSHARHAAWTELPLAGADRERVVNSG